MLIPVVNDQDEVIGHKERDEITKKDIYRISALWLLNEKGEILLARRAWNKLHSPGKWGPAVAGTVEQGESYEDNIQKEAAEELGLKGIQFTEKKKVLRNESQKYRFFCQWYSALIPSGTKLTPDKNEVAEIQWISPATLTSELNRHPEQFLDSVSVNLNSF